MTFIISENLTLLHEGEEALRLGAIEQLKSDEVLHLHLATTESVMDIADTLRQYPTDDEDLKLIQILGMRCFNGFASSLKLALSGYSQTSAMILRDLLETAFLLDLFRSDKALIAEWRMSGKQKSKREFGPVHVRKRLDERDGTTGRKRAEMYDMFCELAAHPTMQSAAMLRPLNMDAQIGPL